MLLMISKDHSTLLDHIFDNLSMFEQRAKRNIR